MDAAQHTAWMTTGDDPWDVYVCHVPAGSSSAYYSGLPLRRDLHPEVIAGMLSAKVTDYFDKLSHGMYRPQFRAGGEVTITADDEPQACVDQSLTASDHDASAHGVLVVADAEHNASQPGGFANAGSGCDEPCKASVSRRSVYVGAADFSPDWGDRPPMDLIEHELGHALGWPHSGFDASSEEPDESALDVMSNSAAPRDVNPDRRDAPDTLAVNRLAAGWMQSSAIAVVGSSGATVTLAPSTGTSGTRVAVIELDAHRFLTVELLTADGFDDHLPASGVAVHRIDATSAQRTQTPLVGLPPYDRLLVPGQTFSVDGWSIAVADGWKTSIHPLDDVPTVSG